MEANHDTLVLVGFGLLQGSVTSLLIRQVTKTLTPKVCPVAAQVITFTNDGAVGPLLGVFILLQNICIITGILLLVSDPLVPSPMLTLVVVGIAVLNICWFWWWLILWYVGFEIH